MLDAFAKYAEWICTYTEDMRNEIKLWMDLHCADSQNTQK